MTFYNVRNTDNYYSNVIRVLQRLTVGPPVTTATAVCYAPFRASRVQVRFIGFAMALISCNWEHDLIATG